MLLDKKLLDTLLEINKKFVEYSNERWITIKPHGDDSDDYRRLKLEDGETPKEAIERKFGDNVKGQKHLFGISKYKKDKETYKKEREDREAQKKKGDEQRTRVREDGAKMKAKALLQDFDEGKIGGLELNRAAKTLQEQSGFKWEYLVKEVHKDEEARAKKAETKKQEQPKSDYETKKQAYHDAIKARIENEKLIQSSAWGSPDFYKYADKKRVNALNKALTDSRRAYAEQIMADFQHSDDTRFEDRQQARKERYEDRADNLSKQSTAKWSELSGRTHDMPLGQPNIEHRLDGWYKRNQQLGDSAMKLGDKADYYERKAKSVGKAGISSDDANAIEKLAAKYAGTTSSAERRRIIDRVIAIDKNRALAEKQAKEGTQETSYKGFKAIRNADANRLQLHFDDIPTAEHRSILKSNGFRWSPSNKAWQRQLGTNSEYALERVAKALGQ